MDIYQQALDVQDACNPTGVAHLFNRVATHLRDEENLGTSDLCAHPALQLIADKLIDLMHRPEGNDYSLAYNTCRDKVD